MIVIMMITINMILIIATTLAIVAIVRRASRTFSLRLCASPAEPPASVWGKKSVILPLSISLSLYLYLSIYLSLSLYIYI